MKTFIDTLKAGQSVDDIFIVRDKQLSHKKNGEPFLTFHMADRTGSVKAVVWDQVEAAEQVLASGDFIRVGGMVNTYQGDIQVVVRHVLPVKETENLAFEDFLPSTDRDTEGMFSRLQDLTASVKDPYLSQLLTAFFQDASFVEGFKKAPAAKKMHHAYLGGLLEHTLSIATLAQTVSTHYQGLNQDLLVTGAVLHDIGKIHEFSYTTHIDYSDAGRLLSHIVIGSQMLEEKIQTIDDFPEELAMLVKHMIISHHGTREFGSPQPPMTMEAMVLNFLDDMDAKVIGVRAFLEKENPDAPWTSYHRLMERFFYRGHGE